MRSTSTLCLLALACTPPPVSKDTGAEATDTADTADTNDTNDSADTGEDAVEYITFEGTLAYLFGASQTATREYDCQLYWDVDPEVNPEVVEDCPDCAFAFSVQWALDDVLSRGAGGACDGERNGNFEMRMGFRAVEDLPGTYTGYMLEDVDGTWTDQTMAFFDPSDGRFIFAIGELDEARDEGGITVFDSDQWYGTSIVWDGSARPEPEESRRRPLTSTMQRR